MCHPTPLLLSRTPEDNNIPGHCPLPSIPPHSLPSSILSHHPHLHLIAMWWQWPLDRVCSACGQCGDMALSFSVIWGIVEVMWCCWHHWWPVTWHYWAALSGTGDVAFGRRCHVLLGALFRAGDMVLLGGVVVNDVAVSLLVAVLTSPPQVGSNVGSHHGAQWWQWQPCMMVVVVVGRDGGCHNVWHSWPFNCGCSIWQPTGAY